MIRDIGPDDIPALVALNNAHAAEVNALASTAFAGLVRQAFAARIALAEDGVACGFLISLSQATPSQGPNHAWFLDRHPAFAYVDRVVVAPAHRGSGVARGLYADLETAARRAGLPLIGCEVNLDPPNPGSLAFHERLGFTGCGEATDPRNGKRVRYLLRQVA